MRELVRLHLYGTMADGNPNSQLSFYVCDGFIFKIEYRQMVLKRIIIRAYTTRYVSKTAVNSHGAKCKCVRFSLPPSGGNYRATR